MSDKPEPKRRNTKMIGFSEKEYKEIITRARRDNLYPRQLIMLLIRNKL